ncbi:SAM-dependent methyltransferase [Rhodopseudomonas thermotolerans]|uniref:SAM-dependent methyltransferase n=2 Tax=Rhodopseudomonas TaxID=1073 RepID=A0A336JV83_9BRAD|nr:MULTISPECIES: class I SAM-dependent methyltransferase [Rhodopseudomonas]RED21275.1 SAM-dependent methyltransferase [Rhodopseudomonas pentothenatexigens]REF86853.1 SAM-dependent methyltransferase [Rhodopseudomonas thermotolerans]SSW93747.1 SAM-dependent methyltransferase [Rhodopseudomonas pentothenatexigens]
MSLSRMWDLLTGRDRRAASSIDWDARYGTDTRSTVELHGLTIAHDSRRFGERYQASDPSALADAVAFTGLDPRLHRFVDLGCGKGRMLIVAAELGFKSCVGVEFAGELAATAKANVAAAGFKTISIVHGDAGAYAFPEQPFVLYLFNPFGKPIMERVRDNLAKLRRAEYYVIYKNPRERRIFDEMPTLRYLGPPPAHKGVWGVHVWAPRGA